MAGSCAVVFVGEFVASGLAAFAGLVGGGVGEEGVAAGFPAGSGVGEGADDQGGLVVGVVGGADGSVFGTGELLRTIPTIGMQSGAASVSPPVPSTTLGALVLCLPV